MPISDSDLSRSDTSSDPTDASSSDAVSDTSGSSPAVAGMSGRDVSEGDIPDVLARICADTRAETARRQASQPLSAL